MNDTYRYETSNERIDIRPSVADANFFIWVHEGRKEAAILIPNTEAPTVAAELLKAAGHDNLATYLGDVIETLRAETEAATKLQERRDAIAAKFDQDGRGYTYATISFPAQNIIDRLIELEDKQAA